MIPVLTVVLLALLGNAMIYTGIAFINGRLLPGAFAAVYAVTVPWSRTLLMAITVFYAANLVLASVFRRPGVSPTVPSAAILGTLAVVLIANSLLLGGKIAGRGWLAALVMVASCLWFAFETSTRD